MSALYRSLFVTVWLIAIGVTMPVRGAELKMLSGAHQPFSIAEYETGIHVDVVTTVMTRYGHTVTTDFVPFINIVPALKEKKFDIVVPVFVPDLPKDMHVSRDGFAFQNGAVTLKGTKEIHSFDDFQDQRLIAFRGAKIFLGSEYATAVGQVKSYGETSRFLDQLGALARGDADISIGDIHLVSYAAVQHPILTSDDLVLNLIFDPLPYHFVFKDEEIRDQFDQGFKQLVESGDYQRIVSSYITE